MADKAEELRQKILELTAEYHAAKFAAKEFGAGDVDGAGVGHRSISAGDMASVVDAALDGWFTTGRWAKEFARKLALFVGVRSASLVNSEGRARTWWR